MTPKARKVEAQEAAREESSRIEYYREALDAGDAPGNRLALLDALEYLVRDQGAREAAETARKGGPRRARRAPVEHRRIEVPVWLLAEALRAVVELEKQRLRPGSRDRRVLLQDMIDFERYEAVEDAMEHRAAVTPAEWRARRRWTQGKKGPFQGGPMFKEPANKYSDGKPGSLFERVQVLLQDDFAAGEAAAIKKSWERVKVRLKENPARYRVPAFVVLEEERPPQHHAASSSWSRRWLRRKRPPA